MAKGSGGSRGGKTGGPLGTITDKGLTPDQEASLSWYQNIGHDRINEELSGARDVRDQYTLDRTTGNLDAIMNKSRINKAVVVHRGILPETDRSEQELARYQVGKTIIDPRYVSTTRDKNIADKFGAQRVHFKIKVPRGSRAVYMPVARPLSGNKREKELLLPRNTKYKVVKRVEKDGRITITLEVIP